MSKIFVDELAGIANANTVTIPGHVIQVVEAVHESNTFTTSSSYSDVFQIQITPSNASSKIYVCLFALYQLYGNNASTVGNGNLQITDGSNNPLISAYLTNVFPNTTGYLDSTATIVHLDSPNSTSAQTYKCRQKSGVSGQRFGTTGESSPSNNRYRGTRLIAMEIAG
jgi:hypothetical protein